jgi:hypothetical protein
MCIDSAGFSSCAWLMSIIHQPPCSFQAWGCEKNRAQNSTQANCQTLSPSAMETNTKWCCCFLCFQEDTTKVEANKLLQTWACLGYKMRSVIALAPAHIFGHNMLTQRKLLPIYVKQFAASKPLGFVCSNNHKWNVRTRALYTPHSHKAFHFIEQPSSSKK